MNTEKTWIVDRIEGELAILECDGESFEISIKFLPDLSEGDQLLIQKQEADEAVSTLHTLQEAKARLERLKQRSEPPPDVFDL